ncbi:acyl-CoA dehydrogenase family protein [Leptospira sp. 2 VSF19]|uniref:Acyl-CoA dehydrogenase family protein n=1 Tax=Leptospira soteropolitanensis TaxID=2950025 RepID=A0AAW5VH70_9LEPT|nr:acyl-CoA dehydrogenase family protein [Leptospira soteropolitanensis]MCW7493594.1 acyl-CoA dehydrogenase family protein [Leptospira soteropolitanensis]MCW7501193.1 acyl-CoA dehydrogenase family protein [Leptospira soteropolitanensis]MCW7523621.1 acyl-CoA dehydrogenase family protein [Leptospira soteropolitanensis]MCW7527306.1 acyl-CoA dehydrogenase family protein [Leptospira soteropolitanensis]MCW7531163.1 acyl-CoA dehydrogenase family protein [Leptospira soteropolitanensis]
MIANNYFLEDEDLQIIYNQILDWDSIIKETEGEGFFDHQTFVKTNNPRYEMAPSTKEEAFELYTSSLEAMGDFFGNDVSQKSQIMDRNELKYLNGKVIFPKETIEIYEKFRNTGLMAYSLSREAGGLAFPATVGALYAMLMARADVAFCMTTTLLNLAQIVDRFGTPEQVETYATKAATGECLFAMSLTEPDYGSDLNNVRTVAVKQEDGSYRLTGTKRFISQGCGLGDHPALLLTLARTGKSEGGARGLSVFIVKSEDVFVAGIEKKMGIHASPTCEIVYDNTYGEILGEEGLGLTRYTAGMTNFMRLVSASGGCGGGAAAYFECVKYANERKQFGKPIGEIPAVAEMIHKIKRETNAMRLLTLETARVIDMYQHHQIRMEKAGKDDREIRKDEKVKYWSTLASTLTPMAKYYSSEEGHKCTNLAVQVFGGAGYTEDYDISRMFRDSRINTIYEGTSQIHVRIATGAILAGMAGDGNFRKYLNSLKAEIQTPSTFLLEQERVLEESILVMRNIQEETRKETVAENLMIQMTRYICSLLYEKSISKIKDQKTRETWSKDCLAYVVDSAAIAQSCLYRIQNFG